jgi:PIN domain nuclease of toxin-antitoxin system
VKLLLDTHALLWWFDGDRKLSNTVRTLIEDQANDIHVSAASVWEIATKVRIGKLPQAARIAPRLPEAIAEQGFLAFAITVAHSQRAGWLPGGHRDPFDRMLAAQALIAGLPIASTDALFDGFGVARIW